MQNIDLICVGKLNAPYFAAGVAEYQKRLGAFCNFRIIELPEAAIADKNASDAQISKALDKEATAILSSLRKGEYLAALCVEGKQFSSEELAKLIADRANSGAGGYCICNWLIPRAGGFCKKSRQRKAVHGTHHDAAPTGPPCTNGTDLPRLHHQQWHEISQII